MTTLDLIDLLFAFAFGAAVSTVICLWVHRQHKESWQAEYRRLVSGIEGAIIQLDRFAKVNVKRSPMVNYAIQILQNTYNGE